MDILSDLLSNRSVVFYANLFVPLQFIRNWQVCRRSVSAEQEEFAVTKKMKL